MIMKYKNKKVEVDGIIFDSKKEAHRYGDLKLMERAGKISDLKIQPKFAIAPEFRDGSGKKHRARFYIADFEYIKDGIAVVEDVKSPITKTNPVYSLKKHLFLYHYPAYDFVEV